MKILLNKNDLNEALNRVSDLGFVPTMGSLHKGHISILNQAIKVAKNNKLKIGLLTFDPNPKEYFSKDRNFKIINLVEKQKILSKMKLDFVIVLKFISPIVNSWIAC